MAFQSFLHYFKVFNLDYVDLKFEKQLDNQAISMRSSRFSFGHLSISILMSHVLQMQGKVESKSQRKECWRKGVATRGSLSPIQAKIVA